MNDPQSQLPANSRIRLNGDSTRRGVLTGRTRPGRGGTGYRYQVQFSDSTNWVPSDQIEEIPVEPESPIDLLQAEKLGHAIDLRQTLTHVYLTGRPLNCQAAQTPAASTIQVDPA